jgi:hypothetical protein
MKTANQVTCLGFFLVLVFFIFPAGNASALGPDAGNCNWGKYSESGTTYLSPVSGDNAPQINAAVAAAPASGTVFLKSGTYNISQKIVLKSGITLEGDKDAIVRLKDHAGWTATHTSGGNIMDPLIGASSDKGAGGSSHDITIRCFTIDGNAVNNTSESFGSCIDGLGAARGSQWMLDFSGCESKIPDSRYLGLGYYTPIYLTGSNFSIHDMTMKDGVNDGIKINHGSDVKIYNNDINKMGHEGMYLLYSHGVEVYGNKIEIRSSDGVRGDSVYDFVIHDNEIFFVKGSSSHPGNAAIQLSKKSSGAAPSNVQIYRNVFHDTAQSGVWLSVGPIPMVGGKYPVEIHHNIFLRTGTVYHGGGVQAASSTNSIVYNNIFDSTDGPAINGGATKVLNNIIVGTKGAGVSGTSDASYNCFYNNSGGDGTSSSTNGNGNPLFANQAGQDYHLMSKAGRWNGSAWVTDSQNSPCIDWGIPSGTDSVYGAYANEPANNGGRVNAGLFGNTTQASLTGNSPQSPMPPAPKEEAYPKGFTTGSDEGGGDTGGGTEPSSPYQYDPNTNFPDITPPTPINPAVPSAPVVVAPLFPSLIPGPYDGACMTGDAAKNTAGFIPCGKKFNDPATKWDECEPCNLCHMILMGQLVVEFMIKAAAVAASLALIFAGFIYIFAAGKSELVSRSKLMMKYTLIGFIVIFIAWAITDSLLMTLGYIDPIGGNWYTIC